jgi:asparagine synthase (glutamine-hydrolysing)
VLSGEGADELFAGYVGYKFDTRRNGVLHDLSDYEVIREREIRQNLWGDPDFHYDRVYVTHEENKRAVYSVPMSERFDHFNSTRGGIVNIEMLKGRHLIHKRSYLDFKLRVSDHLVADHGDRVCYANSVEARYPFLDVDLMNFVKTIPPAFKLKGMNEKYILKKFAGPFLPEEIINREKFSFVAPGSPHLLRLQDPWVQDLLSYDRIARQGYFNPDTIERIKMMYLAKNFDVNQTFEDDLLMIVLTFNIFLDVFEVENFQ